MQYTLYTGIALDELAEKKLLPEPLQSIMEQDEPLYGVDETMALGVTSIYGMIGLTSFGYLDKEKIGVIEILNEKRTGFTCFWMISLQALPPPLPRESRITIPMRPIIPRDLADLREHCRIAA